MPIYIPDNSNVMREMSPIAVTTPDKVTREVAEAWYTGMDGVNRLVYQNEVYLMQNGEFNPKIVSGYYVTKYGYRAESEKTDEGIKMHAQRGNASGSYEGYTYITFRFGSGSEEIQKEYLFNLIKSKKRICFDVYIYYNNKSGSNYIYGWVGLNPSEFKTKSTKLRTYQTAIGFYEFTGVLQVDLKEISVDELISAGDSSPIGAGVYCNVSDKWVEMTVKNIWLE